MYTRSTPEEIIIGCETEEVTEKLIMQLLQKYKVNLKNKMKGSDFIFNGVSYLYYDLNRITISKGGSYIESPNNNSPNNNIIKYNQGEKSLELPFIIYADLERLLKKIDTCQNNPDLSSTTKINQHIPSGYSIYTNCSFDKSNNKLSYYRGEDCMKRFCKDLKDHATKIIDFKKKVMIPLTKEEDNYNKENICYICKEDFNNDTKVRDHCHFTGKYRGAAHNTCNLRYKIPKNIPVIFHNGSTYDYHFIIKELACEFDGNFECLGENTEKYITFSVPIKKRIDNKNIDITYKIKFIDSFRFMATSLSKLFIMINVLNVNLIFVS